MNTSTEVPASTPHTVSWSLIDRAIDAVPASKYALGVGGIAAVVSLVAGLKIGLLVSGLGTVIMLGLMVVLLVFANLVAGTNSLKPVALAFAWGAVVLTVFVGFLVVSTTFWGWPRTWRDILASMPVTAQVSEQVTQGTFIKPAPGSNGVPVDPDYQSADNARVFIHIVNDSQRAIAGEVKGELEREGFVVVRIVVHDIETRPGADVIFWNSNDTGEAQTVGQVLEKLRVVTDALVVDRSRNMDDPVSRQYEVWLR